MGYFGGFWAGTSVWEPGREEGLGGGVVAPVAGCADIHTASAIPNPVEGAAGAKEETRAFEPGNQREARQRRGLAAGQIVGPRCSC